MSALDRRASAGGAAPAARLGANWTKALSRVTVNLSSEMKQIRIGTMSPRSAQKATAELRGATTVPAEGASPTGGAAAPSASLKTVPSFMVCRSDQAMGAGRAGAPQVETISENSAIGAAAEEEEEEEEEEFDPTVIKLNGGGFLEPHSKNPELWNIDGTEVDFKAKYKLGGQLWYLQDRMKGAIKKGKEPAGVKLEGEMVTKAAIAQRKKDAAAQAAAAAEEAARKAAAEDSDDSTCTNAVTFDGSDAALHPGLKKLPGPAGQAPHIAKVFGPEIAAVHNSKRARHNWMKVRLVMVNLIAEAKQHKTPMYIIHPFSIFHSVWDIFVAVILIITVATLPLSMAFEALNTQMFVFNLSIDVIFLCDVVKSFFTGYMDNNETVILEHRMIVKNYLKGWFIPDFVSSIPIDAVLKWSGVSDAVELLESDAPTLAPTWAPSTGSPTGGGRMLGGYFDYGGGGGRGLAAQDADSLARSAKSLKMLRLLRMAKLFRLMRVGRIFRYIRHMRRILEDRLKLRIHAGVIKLTQLFLALLMASHWVGCLQYMICRLAEFPEDSWVVFAGLLDMPIGDQYLWTFYKALSSMIAIGFETPSAVNTSCDVLTSWCKVEHWLTLLALYIGTCYYALLISNVSTILMSMNLSTRLFHEKTQQVNEYMRFMKLPPILRDKIRDYYLIRFSEGKMFQEEEIMADLSPGLRREILKFTASDIVLKVPFMEQAQGGFISLIAPGLEAVVAFTDDMIVEQGTVGEEMYFLHSGRIEVTVAEVLSGPQGIAASLMGKDTGNARLENLKAARKHQRRGSIIAAGGSEKKVCIVGPGSFFGEVSLLLGCRRTCSCICGTICTIHILKKERLDKACINFPRMQDTLTRIAKLRYDNVKKLIDPNHVDASRNRAMPSRRRSFIETLKAQSASNDEEDVKAVRKNGMPPPREVPGDRGDR